MHSLRCKIDDLPGALADAVTDELLGLGALSARWAALLPAPWRLLLLNHTLAPEGVMHGLEHDANKKRTTLLLVMQRPPPRAKWSHARACRKLEHHV